VTRAALIGLTLVFSAPVFLFAGAALGWLSRDREDNAELAETRAACLKADALLADARTACLRADAILACVQADLEPKTAPCHVLLQCPECGPLEFDSDLITATPANEAELDEALEFILTQHSIQAHLTEWSA
jgi:hypothetical protein